MNRFIYGLLATVAFAAQGAVSTGDFKDIFVGNGATTSFGLDFEVLGETHLTVVFTSDLGIESTLVNDVHYSLVLNSNQSSNPGGTITYPLSGTPLAADEKLTAYIGTIPLTQSTVLSTGGGFYPKVIEGRFDYLTQLSQRMQEQLDRALKGGPSDTAPDFDLGTATERAGKYLSFDDDGDVDLTAQLEGGGAFSAQIWHDVVDADDIFEEANAQAIGAQLFPRTADEIAASVTPVSYIVPAYGRGRYANAADWALACNTAEAECYLDADYALTADTELPKRVDFRGYQLTGNWYSYHTEHTGGYVYNWRAKRPFMRGGFFNQYTAINTGTDDLGFVTVMGGDDAGSNPGFFWNDVQIAYTTALTLNADNFDVNQNDFHDGIARFIYLTGGAGSAGLIEANTFRNLDFSNNSLVDFGFLQDDEGDRWNYLVGGYYESGSQIEANLHIVGLHGDVQSNPKLPRKAHVIGTTIANQRLGDFMSLAVNNLVVGGEWDIRDSTGKPPSFTNVGGASVSVQTDTTEPSGAGVRYEAAFEQAFDSFQFQVQPSGSDKFSIYIYYKGTADFAAIETNDGSGAVSHDATAYVVVDSVNNWKKLFISSAASPTATTGVTLFGYAGTGGAVKTMSIGGVFAGAEKAIRPPTRPVRVTRYGSATYDPASLGDGAGATTTITVTGAALGDFARCSFGVDLQGVMLTGYVSAADTVACRFQNESAGTLDLASSTLRGEVQAPF
jgi:hypothetical protein